MLNENKSLLVREEVFSNYKIYQEIINNKLKPIRKDYGMFFTPEWVVDFMVNLIDFKRYINNKEINILEPACGLAQFLFGIKKRNPAFFKKARLFGVEVNRDVINYLRALNIPENIQIIEGDYLLWESEILYDLIIGNPPYGIPSLSEHYTIKIDPLTKEKYKNQYETWYGKYNVYGAFIEKSIKLLKPYGQLIFIIPATFMILDEFKKLRAFLSQKGGTAIIYMGSEVFKPEAEVSAVVLNFIKCNKFTHRLELMEFLDNKVRTVEINPKWQGEVIKFKTDYTDWFEKLCSFRLGDIYEIRISPRTPEIKNNPSITKEVPADKNNYFPILNSKNLKCNKIIYDARSGYWIKKIEIGNLRKFFGIPHIVVGLGFRENGRVAAAIDERCYPWMGDVYHLLRKPNLFNLNFDMTESEVVEYLNSDYVKKYIREAYREITYHLSITQLKNLPLPSKKEWEEMKIKEIM